MLGFLLGRGNLGVDIFAFLSGMSLYFSFCKKKDIRAFMSKRVARLLIPTYLICIPRWSCELLLRTCDPIEFLYNLSLLKLFITGNNTIWFISFIIFCYLAYPLIYSCMIEGRSHFSRITIHVVAIIWFMLGFWFMHKYNQNLFNTAEIWVGRMPAFLSGCAVGPYVYKEERIPPTLAILMLLIPTVYFGLYSSLFGAMWWHRVTNSLMGVLLAIYFSMLLRFIGRLESLVGKAVFRSLQSFGDISLELYLSHILIRDVYNYLYPIQRDGWVVRLLLSLSLSVLLAYILNRATSLIQRFVRL